MTPRDVFVHACRLDVAVRKPGNVSLASPGHGMQAEQFVASAVAAAGPLFGAGAPVGERIEAAVSASVAAAGCNTNLGIVLLCAPIARAVERLRTPPSAALLRDAIEGVLADLTVADAAAAYRAIAHANPGGLGSAASQDVHATPSVDLRAAMALAAGHDRIARQYRDGYADLFDGALPALSSSLCKAGAADTPATAAAVQRLFLLLLAAFPDSHIVRKHGEAVAQNVMSAAQGWLRRPGAAGWPGADPGWAAWDADLKARAINPGTTADLTVATLLLAGLLR